MADIRVHFVHPTDGRVITVTLDDTMTTAEVIGELVANNFVPADSQGYNLAIKGGAQLISNQTLSTSAVRDGDTLRVIPAMDAGSGSRDFSQEKY